MQGYKVLLQSSRLCSYLSRVDGRGGNMIISLFVCHALVNLMQTHLLLKGVAEGEVIGFKGFCSLFWSLCSVGLASAYLLETVHSN